MEDSDEIFDLNMLMVLMYIRYRHVINIIDVMIMISYLQKIKNKCNEQKQYQKVAINRELYYMYQNLIFGNN
jgi:hypothetical protein